jgi:hypothetical protein
LKSFIDSNLVTYEYSYGRDMNWWERLISQYVIDLRDKAINKQIYVYEKCAREHKHEHDWLGFLDPDEFIRLHGSAGIDNATVERNDDIIKSKGKSNFNIDDIDKNDTLERILESKKDACAGVRLFWMMFGSSGIVERPARGVLGNYYKCYLDGQFKSIVQTKYITGKSFIHDMEYNTGNASCSASVTDLRIDHYSTKSLHDYKMKMIRGAGNSVSRKMDYFNNVNALSINICDILHMPPKRKDSF